MKKCIALLLIGLFILTGCAETENDSADLSSNNINQDDKIIELGYEKAEEFSSLYLKIRDELIFLNDEEKNENMDWPEYLLKVEICGISQFDELVDLMSKTCSEEYSRKLLDEIGYLDINNSIYRKNADMLLDFYDYEKSYIESFTKSDNKITYSCVATGFDGGGFPKEDLIYTFVLEETDGQWRISDCNYNGYSNHVLLTRTLQGDGQGSYN